MMKLVCLALISITCVLARPGNDAPAKGGDQPQGFGHPGPCPAYTPAPQFDSAKVNGMFYGAYKVKPAPAEGATERPHGSHRMRCATVTNEVGPDGVVTVRGSAKKEKDGEEKAITKNMTLTPVAGQSGKYTAQFLSEASDPKHEKYYKAPVKQYTIISFDDSHLVGVLCLGDETSHKTKATVLSRQQVFPENNLQTVRDLLTRENIQGDLVAVDNQNCQA